MKNSVSLLMTRADWSNTQLLDGQQSRSTLSRKLESRKQAPVNGEVCQNKSNF